MNRSDKSVGDSYLWTHFALVLATGARTVQCGANFSVNWLRNDEQRSWCVAMAVRNASAARRRAVGRVGAERAGCGAIQCHLPLATMMIFE